jgi:hypothetical protein
MPKQITIPVHLLKTATVLYLALPFYVFLYGWVILPMAVLCACILTYWLYLYYSNCPAQYQQVPLFTLSIILVLATLWLLLSGVGGFGYQAADYVKTNAISKDLLLQNWPLSYQINGQTKYLSHYLGYFITASALFAPFGWKAIQLGQFLQTLIGLYLAVFWLLRFSGWFRISSLLVFIFASGLILPILIAENGTDILGFTKNIIENYSPIHWKNGLSYQGQQVLTINYMNSTEILYWAPAHALSAWLGMGILANDYTDNNLKYSPLYLVLLAFWSPLVLVGLAPFYLFFLLQKGIKPVFNVYNLLIGGLLFLVIASMLGSIKIKELLSHFSIHNRSNEGITYGMQFWAYCYFVSMEVLLLFVPAYFLAKTQINRQYKLLYWLVLLVLLAIPLYRFGQWNDWCTRASLPALFIFYTLVIRALHTVKAGLYYVALFSILAMASYWPITTMAKSVHNMGYKISWQPPKYEQIGNVPSIAVGYPVEQFVASDSTFFYKYLAKKK